MTIFPDANVLVANFMWDGVCAKIVDAIFLERKHDFVISAWVWEETKRTFFFQVPIETNRMKKTVLLCLFLSLSMVIVTMWGCGKPDHERPDHGASESLPQAISQSITTRTFHPPPTKQVLTIGKELDLDSLAPDDDVNLKEILLDVVDVYVNQSDEIYILDQGHLLVKKFSPTGQLLETYGNGQGEGPGEFLTVNQLVVRANGDVWVSDAKRRVITVFEAKGRVKETYTLKESIESFALLQEGKFVVMHGREPFLFTTYDQQGTALNRFGEFVQNQEGQLLQTRGLLVSDEAHTLVYAPTFAGRFAGFTFENTLSFYRETIDPSPFPSSIKMSPGSPLYSINQEEIKAIHVPLGIIGDELHMVQGFYTEAIIAEYIDTYNKRDGSYLYSTEWPFGKGSGRIGHTEIPKSNEAKEDRMCSPFFITERHIYSLCDNRTTLIKWSR